MPLNNKEKEIIWQTFKVLRNTSTQIADCQDLWLSDIRDIETSFWSLYNQFEFIRNNCEKEKK
tara:strand:+ start:2170 stop:2358 length:189 start_codon:yes stop_codon:yes gene_type:complete